MAAIAADRNLLFGLLALQVGLIDQGQLVAAFQAWTRDKLRPLADHLVGRGDLNADDRSAVEALVARHITKHGGDAEKSLAAIPAGRCTREHLAKLGDPDIGATLGHVGSGHGSTDDGDADRTTSYAVGTATSDGQRFRVLRPHARGGLGAVFVALDTELHREVALKQILESHADDERSRHRFLIEAEVTGGLEHPGIVPVYGLGTYADGRPFYAMRFIRGDSLKEAIDRFHTDESLNSDPGRRSLELRKLLRRFTDVCNAIDYAHSRGVLHRDIKPANIILGKHGETLMVDWGLAKAVGRADRESGERTLMPSSASGSAETLPGSALGTPAYMSPEQAEGDLQRLGRHSDVYSLGATLFCLLTGKPPFGGDDLGAVLQAVQRGEVTSPRSVDSTIDRALEAVCLKALALKPEDRYDSARALAEDVERWMADEPVTAWREPFSRRARRWGRRNRTLVTTAAAAVLVALVGTATVLSVQTRANQDLRAANEQTRRERDLARQNFDLARHAVDDYLTRVGQNPLLKEQGLHDLRHDLLEAALRYYQEFLRQRADDPSLRLETAVAHERVGNIFHELGRYTDALAEFDHSLALIEPLVREHPSDPVLATAQVRFEAARFLVLLASGQYPEALDAFHRTSTLGEPLLATLGGTEELADIMTNTFARAGTLFRYTKRLDDALQHSMQAHELAERTVRERPGDLTAARNLLSAAVETTELLWLKGRLGEARPLCQRGIAFGEALLHEHPRDFEIRSSLVGLMMDLFALESLEGRALQRMDLSHRAAEIAAALARENPMLIQSRRTWAAALSDLSSAQSDAGRYAEAEQSARTSLGLHEQLSREVPAHPYFRYRVASSRAVLGKALLKAGKHVEALTMIRSSLTTLEASEEPIQLYNTACYLALASTITDPAEGPAEVDRQRRDADRAMDTIRRAIGRGWGGAELRTDPDFDSLRSRPDFRALLMDLAFPADPFVP
jgi:serine/threonine-protein kinase